MVGYMVKHSRFIRHLATTNVQIQANDRLTVLAKLQNRLLLLHMEELQTDNDYGDDVINTGSSSTAIRHISLSTMNIRNITRSTNLYLRNG